MAQPGVFAFAWLRGGAVGSVELVFLFVVVGSLMGCWEGVYIYNMEKEEEKGGGVW